MEPKTRREKRPAPEPQHTAVWDKKRQGWYFAGADGAPGETVASECPPGFVYDAEGVPVRPGQAEAEKPDAAPEKTQPRNREGKASDDGAAD